MSTRTHTVMFTDLEDYTAAVSRTDRKGLRRLLSQHEGLVTPVVERYHGRVVKNLGDSFMCLFDSATDGLRAALDIQDTVSVEGDIGIRLALATGDVEPIDGDAFGEPVNLAARILSKTPVGEVWFSQSTRMCMNAAEIPWEQVGRFQLKGIAEEAELNRAVPPSRCWLPEVVLAAQRDGNLVRWSQGQAQSPRLTPRSVVLLEGFTPGSSELRWALESLPMMEPSNVCLVAWHLAPADRSAWIAEGRSLVIGTHGAVDQALLEEKRASQASLGSDTLVFDMAQVVDMELVLAGVALPVVPFSQVVNAYAYEFIPQGLWANRAEGSLIRVEVDSKGPVVVCRSTGVKVDGRVLNVGDRVELSVGMRIQAGIWEHTYVGLSEGYFGALLCDSSHRLGVMSGQTAEIGREPHHPGLAFPERAGHAAIQWCSGSLANRAKKGGFTMDRALVGRRQAALTVMGDHVNLKALHERCPTFLHRAGEGRLERVKGDTLLRVGDNVVVGTVVVGTRRAE